jgi:hypothetical protein
MGKRYESEKANQANSWRSEWITLAVDPDFNFIVLTDADKGGASCHCRVCQSAKGARG